MKSGVVSEKTLFQKLKAYGASDYYPCHMPGHKRQSLGELPPEIAGIDITEIDGFDNLHQPEGILMQLQRQAARIYGAEESFFLVNGSTAGILTAISAAVPEGGTLLISRNCHKSVYHGAYLRKLELKYLCPETNAHFDLCEAVKAEQVEQALKAEPGINAVLIVSPTYEGRLADVAAIAKAVHAHGIPLIVDEAHGAHLGFHTEFAENSCRLGADLVVHSVHKTLPAMTQTALLHCNGSLVDRDRVRRFLRIYQSSSPSYVLLSSIENAVRLAETHRALFDIFLKRWKNMNEALSACKHLRFLPGRPEDGEEKPAAHDIGKLVISVKDTDMTGEQLYCTLLTKYHIQLEMACETYCLAMFTIGDTQEGYERLTNALLEIDRERKNVSEASRISEFKQSAGYLTGETLPRALVPFYEAWDNERVYLPLEKAFGRCVGDFINLYPPGTPILVPGEILTKEAGRYLLQLSKSGLTVQGLRTEKGCALFPVLTEMKSL